MEPLPIVTLDYLKKEPKGYRAVGSALERRKAPEVRSTSVATICRMVVAY